MRKTKLDVQKNCEEHIFRVADNIERLLNSRGVSLYKLTTGAEIDGLDTKEKQLFANLIYNFIKKLIIINNLQILKKLYHILLTQL